MELVLWRSFDELSSVGSEMDRLWEDVFGERTFPRVLSKEWAPSVDVSETKENLIN